jgi:hypothetical protein
MVEQYDNMFVIPQFPMWFLPGQDDTESDDELLLTAGDQGPDDEMDVIPDECDEGEQDIKCNDLDHDDIGNTTSSSMGTIPAGNAAELFPDFAIVHLLGKRLPEGHPHFERLHGILITHECCPVVVENKKFPERSLTGRPFIYAVESLLSEAQLQLGMQCYHLFQKYPCAMTTIAIAAAGDLWTHREINRNEVPTCDGDEMVTADWERLDWPTFVTLGTTLSNERIQEIHGVLEAKRSLALDP